MLNQELEASKPSSSIDYHHCKRKSQRETDPKLSETPLRK